MLWIWCRFRVQLRLSKRSNRNRIRPKLFLKCEKVEEKRYRYLLFNHKEKSTNGYRVSFITKHLPVFSRFFTIKAKRNKILIIDLLFSFFIFAWIQQYADSKHWIRYRYTSNLNCNFLQCRMVPVFLSYQAILSWTV